MNGRMSLCARLGIAHPIIQAPMGGGGSTPELVAAVSNAGGLGSLAAAYLTPQQIHDGIAAVRRLTNKPFGVNLFAGGYDDAKSARGSDATAMLAILGRHHAALGLPPPELPETIADPFPGQFEAVLRARVPVFSFTFGIPGTTALQRLREQGTVILGTATTVDEAHRLAEAGVDAVVAQGSEAGAHRGTFAGPFEMAMIGTIALVPQIVDAIPAMPVIASGGIMDGRGIVAARALGAQAVQMGTAFLVCDEAGIPDAYKAALINASEDRTTITRAFSGRPARGVVNTFIREAESVGAEAIPPFPLQNTLTRAMRNAAAKAGDVERLSLWGGQGLRLARRLPAAELVHRLVAESNAAISRLSAKAD